MPLEPVGADEISDAKGMSSSSSHMQSRSAMTAVRAKLVTRHTQNAALFGNALPYAQQRAQ